MPALAEAGGPLAAATGRREHGDAPEIEISEALIRRFDRPGPRYTSYPSADRFDAGFGEADYLRCLAERAEAAADPHSQPPFSLYVHLPFCASLCYFCACNKVVTRDRSRAAHYLRYVTREIDMVAERIGENRTTTQLHLGGGTPTFFSLDELSLLTDTLRQRFAFAADAELGVEIDPRTVDRTMLRGLAALGFNRTSFGVQDFDPQVQAAVNRIQPFGMVERALMDSREAGFESVNVDLIYGLPHQSPASFERTLDAVLRLAPDRIALYNYAHLPSRFKAQRLIPADTLPSPDARLGIFMASARRLLDAGYVYIGLDHFAKPDDELSRALADKSLHRNFQGYTTRAECDLIGFGVSSIGKIGRYYVQSTRSPQAYYAALDAGHLPTERGLVLDTDDLLRRDVIMTVMCSMPLDFELIGRRHGIDFAAYFAPELSALAPYCEAGLVELKRDRLCVSAGGRLFVRAIAMIFDRYLGRATGATYSKLI